MNTYDQIEVAHLRRDTQALIPRTETLFKSREVLGFVILLKLALDALNGKISEETQEAIDFEAGEKAALEKRKLPEDASEAMVAGFESVPPPYEPPAIVPIPLAPVEPVVEPVSATADTVSLPPPPPPVVE